MDGGGSHADAGGGYSGGTAEASKGSHHNGESGNGSLYGGGASYYSRGRIFNQEITINNYEVMAIGGQGGTMARYMVLNSETNNRVMTTPYIDDRTCVIIEGSSYGGDGGVAGKGGNIKVSETTKILAYNGNRYTDGTHNSTDLEKSQNQCEIYAQSGNLRDVYKYNIGWTIDSRRKYAYYEKILGDTINEEIIDEIELASVSNDTISLDKKYTVFKNLLIRKAQECDLSGYKDSSNNFLYGIGSGAGYIELSNGTYTIDSSLN